MNNDNRFVKILGVATGTLLTVASAAFLYKLVKAHGNCCSHMHNHNHSCDCNNKESSYKAKKEAYTLIVDDRYNQIKEISAKLKEDIINEQDSEKRRQLIDNAMNQIRDLKQQIRELMCEEKKNFSDFIKSIKRNNYSKKFGSIFNDSIMPLMETIKEKFSSMYDPVTDCETIVDCCTAGDCDCVNFETLETK